MLCGLYMIVKSNRQVTRIGGQELLLVRIINTFGQSGLLIIAIFSHSLALSQHLSRLNLKIGLTIDGIIPQRYNYRSVFTDRSDICINTDLFSMHSFTLKRFKNSNYHEFWTESTTNSNVGEFFLPIVFK